MIQVLSGPPIKAGGADSVVIVDNRNDIRDFLASRRARITPQQAGLPAYGGNRRVPGLRREEVALLAGVSVDYYTRLERGNLNGVSESVLEALAHALQLDEAERAHLFDLARAADRTMRTRHRPAQQRVRPNVHRILDAIGDAHNVRFHRTGLKDIHHPVVGDLHLTFEAMDLAADSGLSLVVYAAEPGSTSQDGLNLLASWAATLDQTEAAQDAPETEHRGLESQGR